MKLAVFAAVTLLAGCAAVGPGTGPAGDACKAETARLQGLLAAEVGERQRIARAAGLREEALRRQLEAMKSIERGILDREDRMRTETRR